RKAYFLEDKQIPSVGVFDEVTWMDFGGNTRDLELNWRRNRQDYDSTPTILKKYIQCVETVSPITSDGVKVTKGRHHGFLDDVRLKPT
ncbi:hypothetical protein Tco_0828400, partial [Tanacetum coccineum]